jgi:hypothetical protein
MARTQTAIFECRRAQRGAERARGEHRTARAGGNSQSARLDDLQDHPERITGAGRIAGRERERIGARFQWDTREDAGLRIQREAEAGQGFAVSERQADGDGGGAGDDWLIDISGDAASGARLTGPGDDCRLDGGVHG